MIQSLSIVLPVLNAERALSRWVAEGIGVAADLTNRFELLVLDEGSDDDTFEAAAELARTYPQVQAIRAPLRPRPYLICPVGVTYARGEAILYRPVECDQPLSWLAELWPAIQEVDLAIAVAGAEPAGVRGVMRRLWGARSHEPFGLRLVRRATAQSLHLMPQPADEADLPGWLDQLGCRWKAIRLAERHPVRSAPGRPPRPKYLTRATDSARSSGR